MKNSEVTTHSVGEVLSLQIRVHNSLSSPLIDVLLQLYLFQDYQNGIMNQQLDGSVATIGSTEVNLEKVIIIFCYLRHILTSKKLQSTKQKIFYMKILSSFPQNLPKIYQVIA